jgi:hypothetical protein
VVRCIAPSGIHDVEQGQHSADLDKRFFNNFLYR